MRKIKTTTILTLLLITVSQGVFAQLIIFGNVVDAKDGSGIPGASVIVKGTIIGGVTNSSGNFGIMNVPSDAILQVSYVGYKTVEIPVENQTRFEITLELDVQALGDVVVTAEKNQRETVTTAMGIERDPITLTTAVYQVSGDELRKAGANTIAEGLVGKIPSLNTYVDPSDGMLKIKYIRAIYHFGGPLPPLYVIDGVPMVEDPTWWLNIEHIERVTVLPSANAAILYGSQALGGAIVITTKK